MPRFLFSLKPRWSRGVSWSGNRLGGQVLLLFRGVPLGPCSACRY